ncbi:LysR family transcriptional regulator [Sutterella wadsworthensis]
MQLDRTPPYSSLLLLKTLCEKRNLAAAAEVLGLSASSASRHLSEMRELFDDKLFTRFPGGLVPTRRALEIAAQSEPILDGYAALMRPARFNPAEMTREVRIGCADNAPFSLFP